MENFFSDKLLSSKIIELIWKAHWVSNFIKTYIHKYTYLYMYTRSWNSEGLNESSVVLWKVFFSDI